MTWTKVGFRRDDGSSHIAWFSEESEAKRMAAKLNGIVLDEDEPRRIIEEIKRLCQPISH